MSLYPFIPYPHVSIPYVPHVSIPYVPHVSIPYVSIPDVSVSIYSISPCLYTPLPHVSIPYVSIPHYPMSLTVIDTARLFRQNHEYHR